MIEKNVIVKFMEYYAPYRIENNPVPPRKLTEIPLSDPELRLVAHEVDFKRAKNEQIGMELASKEILNNVLKWLNNGKGVYAEALFAVLGAMAGFELSQAILETIGAMNDSWIFVNMELRAESASIHEDFMFGDFITDEFISIYLTAADENTPPTTKLIKIAETCAAGIRKGEYWDTPYNEMLKITPKGIVEVFSHKFDSMFQTLTRFPHERPMAYACAAQQAIKQFSQVLPKEEALTILAEYGWRTAHIMEYRKE